MDLWTAEGVAGVLSVVVVLGLVENVAHAVRAVIILPLPIRI